MATFIITIKTRYIGECKTIKARSLNSAKAQATTAFNALSSSIGQITITNENGVKLSHKLIKNSRGKWEDVIAVDAVPAVEKEEPQQGAQQELTQKTGFKIVNEIPDRGNANLSVVKVASGIITLLIGQDSSCVIPIDSNVSSTVKLGERPRTSIVDTISNKICDDSYLITNFAAAQVLRMWTYRPAASVGFVHTKNGHLVIVTEREAQWLDAEFFPLMPAINR